MYELINGSKRLVNALYNRKDNRKIIERLAHELDYIPAQLAEDITALNDFMDREREKNES